MKIGIVITGVEAEKVCNAFRLGIFSLKKGHTVSAFFLGKGVECSEIEDETFNVKQALSKFVEDGGIVYACGSCLKSRGRDGAPTCPMSTMEDLMRVVEESDRVLTF